MLSSDEKVIGYFLTKPCVVKLVNNNLESIGEMDPRREKRAELSVTMYPWAPLAKEKLIPLSTDWVVTMITPIDKIHDMYVEDILHPEKTEKETNETDQTDSSDE